MFAALTGMAVSLPTALTGTAGCLMATASSPLRSSDELERRVATSGLVPRPRQRVRCCWAASEALIMLWGLCNAAQSHEQNSEM